MPSELHDDQIQRLARFGAEARLQQIEQERQAILNAFPDLGATRPSATENRASAGVQDSDRGPRRRRGMSAARRAEVSARMKRYWAERRKQKRTSAK